MRSLTLAFALAGLVAFSAASCPNMCSGHGRCGMDEKCTCFFRWSGSDCSQRLCKEGINWAPDFGGSAHSYSECSNNGNCNRQTGECECFTNFEGAACERMECPNDCSGHGICETIEELADYNMKGWDFGKVRGCRCEANWEGNDCSMRMCPRGDDPLTIEEDTTKDAQRQQWIFSMFYNMDDKDAVGPVADGSYALLVTDLYGNTYTTRAIAATPGTTGNAQLHQALLDLPIFENIDYDWTEITDDTTANAGVFRVSIRLDTKPYRVQRIEILHQPLCNQAGCFPKRDTVFQNSGADTLTISRTEVETFSPSDLHESAVCSNRGTCDSATGNCVCHQGHYGLACERQTILV